jgi:hypothetical protein
MFIWRLQTMNKLSTEMYIWYLEPLNKINTEMYIWCLEAMNKLHTTPNEAWLMDVCRHFHQAAQLVWVTADIFNSSPYFLVLLMSVHVLQLFSYFHIH